MFLPPLHFVMGLCTGKHFPLLQNLTPSLLRERVLVQLKLCLFSTSTYQNLKASKRNIHKKQIFWGKKKGFKLSVVVFSVCKMKVTLAFPYQTLQDFLIKSAR